MLHTHKKKRTRADTILVGSTIAILALLIPGMSNAAVVSNVTATPVGTSTATVLWTTDMPANSQVMYGLTSGYGSSTPLDTATTTSHSEMITGLMPSTMYHFAVQSIDASSTVATSTDQTFTTMAMSTTSTTTIPMISNVVASSTGDGAVITWMTDQSATSQVAYGLTSSYANFSFLNTSTSTAHAVTLTGLNAGTMYHFQVISGTSAGNAYSADMLFTTLGTTSTTTTTGGMGTSTDPAELRVEINQLWALIIGLQNQITTILNDIAHGDNDSGMGTTTPPTMGSAWIDQDTSPMHVGGGVDFGGHGFGHEENVTVSLNGMFVTTAHADGGGNFSTGTFSLPMTAGTYTYVFTGVQSGDVAHTVVTVM